MRRPGRELGAKETGMSVYELPPGQGARPGTGDRSENVIVERSSKVDYYAGEVNS